MYIICTDMRRCKSSRLIMTFRVGYRSPNSQEMLKFLSLSKACLIISLSTAICRSQDC